MLRYVIAMIVAIVVALVATLYVSPQLASMAVDRFTFDSPEEVDAWHKAGVENGGASIEDPPGYREISYGKLYLAYLRDPDGNKLCGLHRPPQ